MIRHTNHHNHENLRSLLCELCVLARRPLPRPGGVKPNPNSLKINLIKPFYPFLIFIPVTISNFIKLNWQLYLSVSVRILYAVPVHFVDLCFLLPFTGSAVERDNYDPFSLLVI
jgi:hypothetical protein